MFANSEPLPAEWVWWVGEGWGSKPCIRRVPSVQDIDSALQIECRLERHKAPGYLEYVHSILGLVCVTLYTGNALKDGLSKICHARSLGCRLKLDEEGMQALITLGAGDMRRTLNIFQARIPAGPLPHAYKDPWGQLPNTEYFLWSFHQPSYGKLYEQRICYILKF